MSDAPGPRLTDAEFFTTTLIARDRPLLAEAARAAESGDVARARTLFARDVRESLQPERFLSVPRSFSDGGSHMHEGESALEAAERILAGELISCGTPIRFAGDVDWFANPTYNKYREWTWQLSRHSEWGILAECYRATGDERYAEGFVRLFRSWVRQALAPDPRGPAVAGNETLCWRTIELGIRMAGAWPWALHTFYRSPAFTDDDLVDFYKSVWEQGERLRNRHRTHNWLIMEMNGLAQIGLLHPQLADAPAWKAYAVDRLVAELPAQVYPDGFQYELSTNYHQVNIRNYQWLWDVCDAYEEPVPPEFGTWLERMHDANVRLARPNGLLPDLGDGRDFPVAELVEPALERFPHRADFRWAASRGTEGTPPAVTSTAFGYAGYYVMRTSWDPDAVWVLVDGGPYGMAHQHEDKLNVLVHAYGRTLLTEAGNYAYDRSPMRQYVLSTRAHNTIRVDGLDQNRRLRFDRTGIDINAPTGASWHSDDRLDVVTATYDEGYGPEADTTVTHRRTVVLDKTGGSGLGPYVVVIDRLTAPPNRPHHYEALWHLDVDPADARIHAAPEAPTRVETTTPDEANLTALAAGPAGLTAELVSGQTEPEWQGWKAFGQRNQGEYTEGPTIAYRWTATGSCRLVTVLYPRAAGTTCPIVAVVADADPNATTIGLHLINGATLELDETSWPVGNTTPSEPPAS